MNQDLLKGYIEGVNAKGLNVRGIVVRQHGEVIASHDFVPPERIQLFSASKTFTSMAVGIAVSEGYFRIEDSFAGLLSDMLPSRLPDGFEKITVWNLLTMSTGHAECPIFKMQRIRREEAEKRGEKIEGPGSGGNRGRMADEWFSAFINEPLTYEPGSFYAYNNGASYMLSLIVQKKTGQSLLAYLKPRIFAPLNIEEPEWDTDSNGFSLGAIGLHLTTRELSRAGQLLLNGGEWDGKQLIPADYVAQMTRKQIETARDDLTPEARKEEEGAQGYGYQVWMCTYPGAYRMDGMLGQFSIGLPTLDAVVAITSQQRDDTSPILRLVWETIVPMLSPE